MHQPLVYILVLNYCSLVDTLECINSIREISYPNYRLLVIDNASPDGDGQMLKEKLPQKEMLQQLKNLGYAGGNNVGFKLALEDGADYIFVVNPDVRLSPNSIGCYVDILEEDSTIGGLNPIQLSEDAINIDESFQRAVLSNVPPDLYDWIGGLQEVKTLFGAALMLPASTIERVGGFDPLFFAYGEEEDFCRRIKQNGLKLVVTNKEPVIHKRTKENAPISDFVLFLRLKGSYLYNLKSPTLGFRYAVKHALRDLLLDLQLKRSNIYPFNRYSIKRHHVLRVGLWVLLHLQAIRRHRKLDKASRAYV